VVSSSQNKTQQLQLQ